MNMVKLYRSVLWVFRLFWFCKRLKIQYAVDSLQGIVYNHGVFALEHDAGEGNGDNGRNDDIEHEIQQEILGNAALGKNQRTGNQRGKDAVDGCRIEHHGCSKLLGIGNHPHLIPINGILEFFEGEYGLPEGFYNGNPPYILYRFIGHIIESVLVFFHFFLHFLSGHRHHNQKAQHYRHKAQKSQPPVEHQQQNQKAAWRRNGIGTVGKLMRQIGFGGGAGFIDDLAQPAAAELLCKPQRQLYNMLHRL